MQTPVRRRPLWYEFVLRVDLETWAAVDQLERYVRNELAVAGGHLYPDHLSGEIRGSVFRLRLKRRFSRGLEAVIDGYIVPRGIGGSDIVVRVRLPWWWSSVWAVFAVLVMVIAITDRSATTTQIVTFCVAPAALFAFNMLWTWSEGATVRHEFEAVYPSVASAA